MKHAILLTALLFIGCAKERPDSPTGTSAPTPKRAVTYTAQCTDCLIGWYDSLGTFQYTYALGSWTLTHNLERGDRLFFEVNSNGVPAPVTGTVVIDGDTFAADTDPMTVTFDTSVP
jgi:hypothetical protein